jgi:hypothetical protein
MHQHKYDMVRVELADTTVRVTNPGGSPGAPGNIRMGTVAFGAKGMAESQETTGNTPRHAIMIELKDVVVPPIRNTSGYPDAFPREGAKKVLDNARVVVWDYSWTPGKPTAMHFMIRTSLWFTWATAICRQQHLPARRPSTPTHSDNPSSIREIERTRSCSSRAHSALSRWS